MKKTITITFDVSPAPWRPEIDLGEAGIASEVVLEIEGQKVGKLVHWYNDQYGLFLDDEKGRYANRVVITKKGVVN